MVGKNKNKRLNGFWVYSAVICSLPEDELILKFKDQTDRKIIKINVSLLKVNNRSFLLVRMTRIFMK